jgi:hypothetical protein
VYAYQAGDEVEDLTMLLAYVKVCVAIPGNFGKIGAILVNSMQIWGNLGKVEPIWVNFRHLW